MQEESIVEKLEVVSEQVGKAVQAAKQNDWRLAEHELQRAQVSMVTALRLVELANDIQRSQIR